MSLPSPEGAQPGVYFDPAAYARSIPHLFATVRDHFGNELEVLHDIHERLAPIDAIRLAKELDPVPAFLSRRSTPAGTGCLAGATTPTVCCANCHGGTVQPSSGMGSIDQYTPD